MLLRLYAKIKGCWIKDISKITNGYVGKGSESIVYFSKRDGYVIKNTTIDWPNVAYAFLVLFFANELFPNVACNVIGLNKRGMLIEQPYIKGRFATDLEIGTWLKAHNFHEKTKNVYSDGEYILRDIKPKNVIFSKGDCFFIDPWVTVTCNNKNKKINLLLSHTKAVYVWNV